MDPGCGKTTLAKELEKTFPDIFVRTVETTTREIRKNETDHVDYHFLTMEEFSRRREKNEFFELVEYQFLPGIYGGEYSALDSSKWNVVVVSIEGFISALNHQSKEDNAILLELKGRFIERDGRDANSEEKINEFVLNPLFSNKNKTEIQLNNGYCKYLSLHCTENKTLLEENNILLSLISEYE